MMEALELAVNKGDYDIVWVICDKNRIPGKMFLWAAEHDNLRVFDNVYYFHHLNDIDNVYRAMLVAVERGNLDIVKFVIEKCGPELLDYVDGDDSFPCPLVTAIKHGQKEVMDYLYAHDTGCEDDTHAAAFCAAAAYGPMELVKMIYDNDHENFDGSALEKAFAAAAGKSHLEAMTYFQSKQTFDHATIDKAFVEAARSGEVDAIKYLCNIEGYETSAASLNEAFEDAGSGGHLEMLKFLDVKGNISRKAVTRTFENAIKDIGVLSEARSDQVHILQFLHDKGRVYLEVIDEIFPKAASCCSLAVMKFLYSTGSISTKSVDEAFHSAARENCIEVVEFIYNTGVVTETSVEEAFLNAADRGDLYVMEDTLRFGNNSEVLLEKALRKHSVQSLPSRVLQFLKQKQHIHNTSTR